MAEKLNISQSQTYALVKSGELLAIRVDGRGQWRVERSKLKEYIGRMYAAAASLKDDLPDWRARRVTVGGHPVVVVYLQVASVSPVLG